MEFWIATWVRRGVIAFFLFLAVAVIALAIAQHPLWLVLLLPVLHWLRRAWIWE